MNKPSLHKRVLVTDGYWRKSLAVVRALSGEGLRVDVGERTILSTALFSNKVNSRYIYPSAKNKPTAFLVWLKNLVATNKYDVLIVPEEETSLLIAKNRDQFSQFINIPIADYETIKFLRNKSCLLAHAQKVGVALPVTKTVSSIDEIHNFVPALGYPFVLKPIIGTGSRGIRYIRDKTCLDDLNMNIASRYGNLLMQEFIPGNKYFGVSVIFNKNNKMRSAFVHQKLRQYPVTGGVSTYAVSVKYPHLIEIAEHLLKTIGWYGIANIEFKIDDRNNTPKLMEVNPRFWGSLQLAISSGINFPYLLYKLAVNGDIEPAFNYKAGIKFRWIIQGDLMHFLSNLFRQHRIDPIFFKIHEKNLCHAIGSCSDPLPILGKILSLGDFLTNTEMKKFYD